MKTHNLILVLTGILLLGMARTSQAERYVVFISGYGGSVWEKSNTPDDWKSLVPSGNIIIMDNVFANLKNALSSGVYNSIKSSDANLINWLNGYLQSRMKPVLLNSITGNSGPVELVLVGHSAGGLIARFLEKHINRWNFPSWVGQVRVIGVLTVSTPHQGIRLAEVSVGSRKGFKNVEPQLLDFKTKVQAPLNPEDRSNTIDYVVKLIAGSKAIWTIDDLPDLLDESFRTIQKQNFLGYEYQTDYGGFNVQAKGFFKPKGGLLIDYLNSISPSAEVRSVFGAERGPTPVRMADEVLGNGQEKETVDNYSSLKRYYNAQEDYWWVRHEIEYYTTRHYIGAARKRANRRKDEYKRKSRRWKTGRGALENVNSTWSQIIGSYRYETRTGTRRVYDPNKCSGGPVLPELYPYSIKAEDITLRRAPDPDCDPWVWETYTYTVRTPLKNDGALSPNYAVWNKSDQLRYSSTRSKGNYYYPDTGTRGGYNHMELRRAKRAYNDSGNGIVKGQKAEPMEVAERWLEGLIRGN